MEKLLKPDEVADMLGIKLNTLGMWRCYKKHERSWVKIGKSVRYRPEDVRAYIDKNLNGELR